MVVNRFKNLWGILFSIKRQATAALRVQRGVLRPSTHLGVDTSVASSEGGFETRPPLFTLDDMLDLETKDYLKNQFERA